MTPESNKSPNAADKMKTVKAAWDKAPSGPKKDAAKTHYDAAEKAHTAKNCVFREIWAAISRDLGHSFHAILGSHFADAGRLDDGFMESGRTGLVKRFRDVSPASQAFS